MGRISVFSPAKINLFLAVVGRMENGFHELASLVAQLDFGDQVTIETEPGPRSVELACDDPSLPTDERNLAYLAASRFLDRYGLDLRARIELAKRIPHGAGLGGGSSNASATLRGLAQLAGIADEAGLASLAAELGSDCPLFLAAGPIFMRGRGERLETVKDGPGMATLRGRQVLIFKPSFSIGTAWAYRALASSPQNYDDRTWAEDRLRRWAEGALPIEGLLHNSFERVAFAKYPAYGVMAERLSAAGIPMLLSGSGSACFALVGGPDQEAEARRCVEEYWGARSFFASAILL